jgi:hypothetical protein
MPKLLSLPRLLLQTQWLLPRLTHQPRPKGMRLQPQPLKLRRMNKPVRLHQRRQNLTAQPKSSLRHPLCPPSLPNPWWPCVATTDPAKSVPRHLLGAMADVMAALASAARAPAVIEVRALAALAIGVLSAGETDLAIAHLVKTEVRVWAIRLSAPSAKPWSALKCRCASWPRKRMARPLAVC